MESKNKLKVGLIVLFLLAIVAYFFVGVTKVGPREVGVKVVNFGFNKGVNTTAYGTGYHWYGPGVDMVTYPTHKINYTWASTAEDKENAGRQGFNFPIKGGLIIGIDLGIEFSVAHDKAWKIYSEYSYNVDQLTDIVIRKAVNDALNTYGSTMDVDSFANGGIVQLIAAAQAKVKKQFFDEGILINTLSMVGAPRYPTAVTNAISDKIKATQEAITRENELRKTEAQAKMDIAQAEGLASAKKMEADGIAYYNKKTQESLTPLLVEMERIKKWDGVLPTTTGGVIPFFNVK